MRASLLKGYRLLQKHIIGPLVERKRFEGKNGWRTLGDLSICGPDGGIWFHAASVGELEALIPVVRKAAVTGDPLILSVFSSSAEGALKRLVSDLNYDFPQLSVHWGYSPWEGDWGSYLNRIKPRIFITHKYEAWPDLWISLVEFNVPLMIVGASLRGSIRAARRLCLVLKGELPKITFLPFSSQEKDRISDLFPGSQAQTVSDPRWERVFQRGSLPQRRANEVIERFSNGAGIRGIIGSAWLGDLKFLFPKLLELDGPIWIVPHKINSESVSEMMEFLKTQGITPMRTSQSQSQPMAPRDSKFLIVDEMGVLAEVYKIADWVYVGGGFGEGVHSTIEPAVHGLPIACGPKGAHKFFEIDEMLLTGQVSVLRTRTDLKRWVEKLEDLKILKKQRYEGLRDCQGELTCAEKIANHNGGEQEIERSSHRYKDQWKSFALSHSNASEKIWDVVEKLKRSC